MEPFERFRCARWAPWWAYALAIGLPALAIGLALAGLPEAGRAFAAGILGPSEHVALVGYFSACGLCLVPLLLLFPLMFLLHLRCGAARWNSQGLILQSPFPSFHQEVFLPWSAVKEVRERAHGLQIVPTPEAALGLWTYHPHPPFAPVPAAERAAALADAAALAGQPPSGRSFGRVVTSPWRSLAALGVLIGLIALLELNCSVQLSAWDDEQSGFAFCASLLAGVLVLPLLAHFLASLSLVEVHPGLLTCGSYAFLFEEIDAIALEGRVLCVSKGPGRSRRARAQTRSLEESAALRAELEGRGLRVARELPPWGKSRRLLARGVALALGALALGISPALWAWALPAEVRCLHTDAFGQGALVVSELASHKPRVLVLTPRPGAIEIADLRGPLGRRRRFGPITSPTEFVLHLASDRWESGGRSGALAPLASAVFPGEGSRLAGCELPPEASEGLRARLREGELFPPLPPAPPSGVISRRWRSLPRLLELALGALEHGPLDDFVRGRTSRRFYDLRSLPRAAEALVAAVDQGRVRWLVAIPDTKPRPASLAGAGFTYRLGGKGPPGAAPPGISRCDAAGRLTLLRASPPSLDELLEARRQVEAGASPSEAAAWLLLQPGER